MRCVPWSIGEGGESASGHHGWSPSILVQVSNILPLNTNGKVQLSQPVVGYVEGSDVADQIARNPLRPLLTPSDVNFTVTIFALEMMIHG